MARDLSIDHRLAEKTRGMPLCEVLVNEPARTVTARVRLEPGSRVSGTETRRGPWLPTDRIKVVA
jgi:hypothetical protein